MTNPPNEVKNTEDCKFFRVGWGLNQSERKRMMHLYSIWDSANDEWQKRANSRHL